MIGKGSGPSAMAKGPRWAYAKIVVRQGGVARALRRPALRRIAMKRPNLSQEGESAYLRRPPQEKENETRRPTHIITGRPAALRCGIDKLS